MFKPRMFAFGTGTILLAGVSFVLGQDSISFPFSIPNDGAVLFSTTANPANVNTGFASIQPDAGSFTPSGSARISFRANGTLLTETTMPALRLKGDGVNFVEANGSLNTGLVIANPNNEPATLT